MANIRHLMRKVLIKVRELGLFGFVVFAINRLRHPSKPGAPLADFKKNDLIGFYRFTELEECLPGLDRKSKGKHLAWFIPDFGIGSGGHLNIFRMVQNLEKLDIASDIYIIDVSQWGGEKQIKAIIDTHFFKLKSRVFMVRADTVSSITREYDIAVATSWQTAYFVRAFGNCRKKAYFVQDFEPYFFPRGSNYFFAEQTYRFGFYGICASTWLEEKLGGEYGMTCRSFGFSYDKSLYEFNPKQEDGEKRIFFYTRPPTDRRGFELGMMALNLLCRKHPDVEVVLAGWDVSGYEIPFKHRNMGVMAVDQLGELYSQCDAALIISFTNLSLLPLEVLASGCPVIINGDPCNTWIDDTGFFIYSDLDVNALARTMEKVLEKEIDPAPYLERAKQFLEMSSWEKEADKVGVIIQELLN